MEVGDIIIANPLRSGRVKLWTVESICLGIVGQESLVELRSITEAPGTDTKGNAHVTTWVPLALLETPYVQIYKKR